MENEPNLTQFWPPKLRPASRWFKVPLIFMREGGRHRNLAQKLKSLHGDVATELGAGEMDFFHGGVGGGLGGFQILAERGHPENASAVCNDLVFLPGRSSVENFDARQFRRVVQAVDGLALFVISRVTAAGH